MLGLLLSVSLALSPKASAPQVHAVLCHGYEDGHVVKPTTRFERDAPQFAVVVSTPIKAKTATFGFSWIALDVGAAAPKNTVIRQSTLDGVRDPKKKGTWWTATGTLSKPNNGWPPGKYRVDVTLDGAALTSLEFTVQA